MKRFLLSLSFYDCIIKAIYKERVSFCLCEAWEQFLNGLHLFLRKSFNLLSSFSLLEHLTQLFCKQTIKARNALFFTHTPNSFLVLKLQNSFWSISCEAKRKFTDGVGIDGPPDNNNRSFEVSGPSTCVFFSSSKTSISVSGDDTMAFQTLNSSEVFMMVFQILLLEAPLSRLRPLRPKAVFDLSSCPAQKWKRVIVFSEANKLASSFSSMPLSPLSRSKIDEHLVYGLVGST